MAEQQNAPTMPRFEIRFWLWVSIGHLIALLLFLLGDPASAGFLFGWIGGGLTWAAVVGVSSRSGRGDQA